MISAPLDQDKAFGPRSADKFVVRLPDGLRDQLKELATKNRRSMNSEIVLALEAHLAPKTITNVFTKTEV